MAENPFSESCQWRRWGDWQQGHNARDNEVIDLKAELEALMKVAEALQGIIDIGKRDTTNPKYDGYYVTAKEALAAAKEPHA